MINEPDPSLLERIRGGDRAAFRVLVDRYQRPLYNAAYRILGSAADAQDITQVVFLRVAQHREDYDPRYKFFSWIYRIAVNESLNLLRRAGRDEPLDDDAPFEAPESFDPERQMSAMQLSAHVQSALMQLKADDRAVLTLRHFSEFSYAEIANALDLDEKTVKSRLFEARGRLRGLLADWQEA